MPATLERTKSEPLSPELQAINDETTAFLKSLDPNVQEEHAEKAQSHDTIPYVRGSRDSFADWGVYESVIGKVMKSNDPVGKDKAGKPRHIYVKPAHVFPRFLGLDQKSEAIFILNIMDPENPEMMLRMPDGKTRIPPTRPAAQVMKLFKVVA